MLNRSFFAGMVRYLLGCIMIAYGITKILKTQFIILPFDVWQQPLEDVWGGSLTWAFLGYAGWFQVLTGLLEFIPAVLLLFRRTAFMGALLLLPMTLNVFLINQAMELWPSTRLLSGVLLLLNLCYFLFEQPRIRHLVAIITGQRINDKRTLAELLINAGLILALCIFFSYPLLQYRSAGNILTGDWLNHHPNEWTLIGQKRNDSILPVPKRKLYFMPYDSYTVISDSTVTGRRNKELKYELNDTLHTLTFLPADSTLPAERFSYSLIGDSMLELKQLGTSNLEQRYRKRVMHKRSNR